MKPHSDMTIVIENGSEGRICVLLPTAFTLPDGFQISVRNMTHETIETRAWKDGHDFDPVRRPILPIDASFLIVGSPEG